MAVSTALMLALLMNTPVVNAKPSDPTEGIEEKTDTVSASGWSLYAKVVGEWHWLWQRDEFWWYWFNHEGGRSTWFSIVIDGPLIIYGQADSYYQSAGTPDGSKVAFTGISGRYTYGRTMAYTKFYDWFFGKRWNASTNWATLGSPPP